MKLSDRDRRALTGGGLVIAALLLYLLFGRGEPEPPPAPPAPVQTVVAPPPAVPQASPVAPPAAPPTDASQLRLHGVMGGGAIIGFADGSQRYVPLGREIAPGLRLVRLEVRHAVLESPTGEIRLGFDAATDAVAAAPSAGRTSPAR